jgi:hypothetical protein
MPTDKITEVLLDALRQAMAATEPQRLYRAVKLPGLFAGRTGANGEAAERALHEELLEITRTDTQGKTPVVWVSITPKGVEFLLNHESPLRALEELQDALHRTAEGVPGWVAEIQQGLKALSERLTTEVQATARRLEALGQRVTDAIRRIQAATPKPPEGTASALPWAEDVFQYLDRRGQGGASGPCPLPELFLHVREREPELSVKDFHSGLRRLYDRGVLRLLPFEGPDALPEPEYALLDGPTVIYYAAKAS